MNSTIESSNKEYFISYLQILTYFIPSSSMAVFVSISITMLKRVVATGILCSWYSRTYFQPFNCDVVRMLFVNALCQLRMFSSGDSFLKAFLNHEWILNFILFSEAADFLLFECKCSKLHVHISSSSLDHSELSKVLS